MSCRVSVYFPLVIWWYQIIGLVSDPFTAVIFARFMEGVLLRTSAHVDSIFPIPFVEEIVLFSWIYFGLFVKNYLAIDVRAHFWYFYSVPFFPGLILCQSLAISISTALQYILKSTIVMTSALLSLRFLQLFIASCASIWILVSFFVKWEECLRYFDWSHIESINGLEKYKLYDINSSKSMNMKIFSVFWCLLQFLFYFVISS